MHIGEAELPALEAEDEPLVVDAEEMYDDRLEIVDVRAPSADGTV
jgi:hypothetical protein